MCTRCQCRWHISWNNVGYLLFITRCCLLMSSVVCWLFNKFVSFCVCRLRVCLADAQVDIDGVVGGASSHHFLSAHVPSSYYQELAILCSSGCHGNDQWICSGVQPPFQTHHEGAGHTQLPCQVWSELELVEQLSYSGYLVRYNIANIFTEVHGTVSNVYQLLFLWHVISSTCCAVN